MEPEQQQPPPIYETAFYVYLDGNGHWMANPDIHAAAELQIKRASTPHDYYTAACTIEKDVITWEAAAKTAAQVKLMEEQTP